MQHLVPDKLCPSPDFLLDWQFPNPPCLRKPPMTHSYRLPVLALAIASALLPLSAQAESRASASLSGIGYLLIDLTPLDGVSASIAFTDARLSSLATIAGFGDDDQFEITARRNTLARALNTGVAASDWQALASSQFSGGQLGDFHSSGQITGNRVAFYTGMTLASNFVLSANTEVVFFGTSSGQAFANGDAANGARGTADSHFYVQDQRHSHSSNMIGIASTYGRSDASSYNQAFELHFRNDANTALHGELNVGTQSAGFDTTPIPEPESWAMLLAGVGLLTALRRHHLKRV